MTPAGLADRINYMLKKIIFTVSWVFWAGSAVGIGYIVLTGGAGRGLPNLWAWLSLGFVLFLAASLLALIGINAGRSKDNK